MSAAHSIGAVTPIDPHASLVEAQALTALGDRAGALRVLDAARQQHPGEAEILFEMAKIFQELNQYSAAARLYDVLVSLRPGDVAVRNNYANALHALGNLQAAEEHIEAALAARAGLPELWTTRGVIAESKGQYELAEHAFARALALKADHVPALSGLAAMQSARGAYAKSVIARSRAITLAGDRPSLRLMQAYDLFRLEQWGEAWAMYEARLADFPGEPAPVARRPFDQPRWQGQALSGDQALLVWMEQGIGEEVMYAGILPEVLKRCPRLVVECEARLLPLFARSMPEIQFVARKPSPDIRCLDPIIAAQIPAASLGTLFRANKTTFPRHNGYLKADPARVQALRDKYRELAPNKKIVGIAWRSKAYKYSDPKSSALADWTALLSARNVQCVSLQYGDILEDTRQARIHNWNVHVDMQVDAMRDLDVFAAQVAACDAVVTVSNATAHIAGGLGVKADVLLPYGPGTMFHWLSNRSDSPWYPSLRLWRQPAPGDWKSLFAEIIKQVG